MAEPLPSAGSVIGRIVFRLLVSAVVSVVAAVVLFLLAVLGAPFTTNLIIWIFVTGVGVIWTFTPFLDFNSGGRQDGAGKP